MSNFAEIIPCGITDPGANVSSLQELAGSHVNIEKGDVVSAVKSSFQDVFGVELMPKADAYMLLGDVVNDNPLSQDVIDNLLKLK